MRGALGRRVNVVLTLDKGRLTPCSMSSCVLPGGKNACFWVAGGAVPMTSEQSRRDALLWPRSESLVNVVWKLEAIVAWLTVHDISAPIS